MESGVGPNELLQDLQQLSGPGRVRYLNFLSQEQKDAVLLRMLYDQNATSNDTDYIHDAHSRTHQASTMAHDNHPQIAHPMANTIGNKIVHGRPVDSHTVLLQDQVTSRKRTHTASAGEARETTKNSKKNKKTKDKKKKEKETRALVQYKTTARTRSQNTSEEGKNKTRPAEIIKVKREIVEAEDGREDTIDEIELADEGFTLPRHELPPDFTQRIQKPQGMDFICAPDKLPLLLAVPESQVPRLVSINDLLPRLANAILRRYENFRQAIDGGTSVFSQLQDNPEESMRKRICVPAQLVNGRADKPQTFNFGGQFGITADDGCIRSRTPCIHVRRYGGGWALFLVPLPAAEREGKTWKELGFWVW